VAETQQSCAHLGASTTDYNTMPKLLLRNAVKLADRAAMREKNLGIWQTYTWANVLEEVPRFLAGAPRAWGEARRIRLRSSATIVRGFTGLSPPRRRSEQFRFRFTRTRSRRS